MLCRRISGPFYVTNNIHAIHFQNPPLATKAPAQRHLLTPFVQPCIRDSHSLEILQHISVSPEIDSLYIHSSLIYGKDIDFLFLPLHLSQTPATLSPQGEAPPLPLPLPPRLLSPLRRYRIETPIPSTTLTDSFIFIQRCPKKKDLSERSLSSCHPRQPQPPSPHTTHEAYSNLQK